MDILYIVLVLVQGACILIEGSYTYHSYCARCGNTQTLATCLVAVSRALCVSIASHMVTRSVYVSQPRAANWFSAILGWDGPEKDGVNICETTVIIVSDKSKLPGST